MIRDWLFIYWKFVDQRIKPACFFTKFAARATIREKGIKMFSRLRTTTALVTVAVITAGGAAAQSSEIAELRARVAALEARPAASPDLKFNLGSSTKLEIYGFVRFEAFYDFDFAQGDLTRAGRVGDPAFATDGEFETSVRVSRFGLRSTTDTNIGDVGTELEFDLFSGSDETTSPNLRLRHAFVTVGDNWLFGQTWSNFMPLSHYPRTSDFNGPVGIAFARTPQVRYSNELSNGLQYSVSIEESVTSNPRDPVFTAAAGYGRENWSARIAGLTGRVNDGAGDDLRYNAFTASGSISPWSGGTLTGTYVNGEALGSFLIGSGDDVVNGNVNDAEGFTLEARQQIGEKWNVGIAYGNADFDNAGSSNTLGSQSVHVNAFYRPTDNLTLGLEYIYIEREDASGQEFDADRIGASITYSF